MVAGATVSVVTLQGLLDDVLGDKAAANSGFGLERTVTVTERQYLTQGITTSRNVAGARVEPSIWATRSC